MQIIVPEKIEDIMTCVAGNSVYIYGGKSIAYRLACYLINNGVKVEAFVVSQSPANQKSILGIPVLQITEIDYVFVHTMVVAVSADYSWEIVESLINNNVEEIVVISPYICDDFPLSDSLVFNMNSYSISPNSFVSGRARIFSDETSRIIIEDGVFLDDTALLLATDHSCIHLLSGAIIGRSSRITAKNNARICLGHNAKVGYAFSLVSESGGSIEIGNKVSIAGNCVIMAEGNNSCVSIGDETTIERHLHMTCHKTQVVVGKDCMFSAYIQILSGDHRLFDEISGGNEITNRRSIIIKDHVWIGMGALLMPGAEVGNGSIVGAQSFINKHFQSNCTIAGRPASIIRNGIRWER